MANSEELNNEEWIFTFGHGNNLTDKCVRVRGSYGSARNQIFYAFGDKWGFQYSAEEWESMKNDKNRTYELETEISLEEAKRLFNGEV